ncbi:hypothetical protein CC85DRAFT_247234 [Cutaneotrichosporon oleaginosum]|uniref:DNA mismatch repair proteins mutS family domain-containing protein n=1 Tax=Cutaneotrichosporon oleaginosum TaxID=879819 RepID=A0A0J0XKM3_9TREE|nr:uncharacterized protein CC85DRAFT_247234 [Cutaneotrichosporon oleaginosum]KLT41663.1 hypothetical protein CC85DRAFT_247234 [Cutaneotrichosporon oleaginosum]TXT08035.1 hypothetical protein COLE_04959 [Cutaneotrichosporon oleaginosum]
MPSRSLSHKREHAETDTVAAENAEFARAVKAGQVPDTALSRIVYDNWKRFPDCILLTQVGNFFESYFEPAIEVAALLGIKLTSKTYKSGSFPFTGFPIHQIDKYLKLLVQDMGHTVVLVEEEKDPLHPQPVADIRRKVARVVTPGTLLDESWLSGHESRYLLAISLGDAVNAEEGGEKSPLYLAYADVSTGEFFTKAGSTADIEDEMARIAPREVVLDNSLREAWKEGEAGPSGLLELLRVLGVHVSFAAAPATSPSPPSPVNLERDAISLLRHHLEYALRDRMPAMPAEGEFNRESQGAQMHIDAATLQALEIRHALRPGGLVGVHSSPLSAKGTLLSVLSRTVTDSGHRLLKRTLTAPSTSLAVINARLALVAALHEREALRTDLRDMLRSLGDVMRIVQRFRASRGDASDVWDVARWVRGVERLRDRVRVDIVIEGKRRKDGGQAEGVARLQELVDAFAPLLELADGIEGAIDETRLPGLQAEEAGEEDTAEEVLDRRTQARWWLRPSFSLELSELHKRIQSLTRKRAKLEARLQEEYGASLTLGTSARWGYVVTAKRRDVLPKERFHAVAEAKSTRTYAYNEWSALGARLEESYAELGVAEARALNRLRAMVVERAPTIQANAEAVDELDVAAGFAQAAQDLNYVRPTLDDSCELQIVNGRHPSVEAGLMAQARAFTPNSTHMDAGAHMHFITGPNQGGKSTLLRQTAVIAILAQAGSFVPADSARVGVVDRVFSRVGARDDLFRDRSTFMLEMVETAGILRAATPRSLVIMDEIGRGTTLHAGMAIAYATLDYILTHVRCRTLFATHYHELARMLESGGGVRGVAFFCTDVERDGEAFAYAYRLRPGINYDSHAIMAAQLAGMPESFLDVARRTLEALEGGEEGHGERDDRGEGGSGHGGGVRAVGG